MSNELLPCPFCGGPGELERTMDRFDYGIDWRLLKECRPEAVSA